ncbi:MAG TPA: methyltransferase domain-containing protein [Acidimicrobiia bacterium]|nr:methyltransferase domain-containing protein [Acidimicrobiia bacterium]
MRSPSRRQDLRSAEAHDAGMTTEVRITQDWREAGAAWGWRANDWACLYEHYSTDVLLALLSRLDIACGSGFAVRLAAGTGADVAGIDASEELIAVARERTPDADLRVGSMFELPWPDESFDAVMSINGIWGGCEPALDEAFRVLRPGGCIGISFWGAGPPLDIRTIFRVLAIHAPDAHRGSMRRLNDIAILGVAEDMLTGSGFSVLERGSRVSVIEWPDDDTAWRAIRALGPAVPALRTNDETELRREALDAFESFRDAHGIYRNRSDHQFVVARKPV